MANTTIGIGIALIILGLTGYIGTGSQHVTALIPSFLGALLGLLGVVARNEKARKHAIHGALVIALVGIGGGLSRVIPALFSGIKNPIAFGASSAMIVLCAAYIVLGVRSFIEARRNRA